jgi:predicted HD superfamily hydrolase involved in NAD metabolism
VISFKSTISEFQLTGKTAQDVFRFLGLFGYQKTAQHCAAVASKAKELAQKFDSDPSKAELAGYLHDISAVIPNDKRVAFARQQMVDVLNEEMQCPMILHQKLSVVIARDQFGVQDAEILSAIGCHTTLKAQATRLDKVVFLADKIAWDQAGKPPYLHEVTKAMEESLDAATLAYLNYLWARRDQIPLIHPWFVEARDKLLRSSINKCRKATQK